MKLLPTFVVKEKQQEEVARKILRTQEVNKLAQDADINLARAQADFSTMMAQNRAKWALEEEEHAERIKGISQEVEALENRKREALIPIQLYKEEADKLMISAQDYLKQAKEKDEQNEFLQEKLEEKLTDISDRETIVIIGEQSLEIAKKGMETQQSQVQQGIILLGQEKVAFHMKQQEEEARLLKRKEEVALAEINFNARREKYERDLEALNIWEIQLADERDTLARERARK